MSYSITQSQLQIKTYPQHDLNPQTSPTSYFSFNFLPHSTTPLEHVQIKGSTFESFGVLSQNCCSFVATLVKTENKFFGRTKLPWHSNAEKINQKWLHRVLLQSLKLR